jgi:hypothetical protein
VRNILHTGLLEAALEKSARGGGAGLSGELEFCAQCEMPLLPDASFCNACGTVVGKKAAAQKEKVAAGAVATSTAGLDPAAPPGTPPAEGSSPSALSGPAPEGAGPAPESGRDRSYDDEEGRA